MKHFVFFVIIGTLLSADPVWAEMYRYKDAGGVVRFTDNLSNVPEKQRAGMSVYENEPAPATPSATEQPSVQNNTSGQNLKIPGKPQSDDLAADLQQSDDISNDLTRIDRLLKIRIAMDEENAQFMKESLVLSETKKTLSGNAAINAYNEKVNFLNTRVDDFEKRRAVFQKEADVFDAVLKKRLTPPLLSLQPSFP